jgi:arabinogalactan oligomer/maltooligosaccharide transport system permease protein
MTPAANTRQRVLVGLVSSLAVVVLLSMWLVGGGHGDVAREQRQREALLVANAVAASVAQVGEDELAARLKAWKAGNLSIESIRVVAGRQLLASTRSDDQAPRGLQREERAVFDLANALRAAAETNRTEGIVRKKTLHIDDRGGTTLTATVPFEPKGQFEGVVQLQYLGTEMPAGQRGPRWGVALLVLAIGAAIGVFLRVRAERRFDLARGIALVALLALALVYQRVEMAGLQDSVQQGNAAIAKLQRETSALFARSGVAAKAEPTAASVWDTDAYRRPLNQVSQAGEPLAGASGSSTSLQRFLARMLWVIGALGVVLLLYVVQGYAARTRQALRENSAAYGYVAPAMIGMLVLVFFPFLYGIVLAFTDTTLFNESLPLRERWIGLDNFVTILGDFGLFQRTAEGIVWNYQNFYWTLMMTVIWTVSNVAIGVSVGFLLALALNTEGLRGKAIYRVLLILPWAIPNYITALVWRGMFHPQFGVVNQALQMFGFAPVAWFDGVVSSFLTGLATNGWLSFPFMMVVILGALQSIPRDMYEAAEVEGATKWQQFKAITLPLLRPTLVPAVVLSVVWTFNMFNIIFLVSNGEPAGANEILITKAYKIAFEQYQYAYAAAYSTVIFAILLVYGYFQTRLTRATETY